MYIFFFNFENLSKNYFINYKIVLGKDIEKELALKENEYMDWNNLTIYICTWNLCAYKPKYS